MNARIEYSRVPTRLSFSITATWTTPVSDVMAAAPVPSTSLLWTSRMRTFTSVAGQPSRVLYATGMVITDSPITKTVKTLPRSTNFSAGVVVGLSVVGSGVVVVGAAEVVGSSAKTVVVGSSGVVVELTATVAGLVGVVHMLHVLGQSSCI